MTHASSVSYLGSEFNDFLFAPIGADRNGMPLSILSALARLDLDPWREAASLARLPEETAAQRLASLIAALPDRSSARLDPGTIAVGLIALLPHRSVKIALRTALPASAATNFRTVVYVIFMVFALAFQTILVSRHLPTQIDDTHATASTTPPQTPPSTSGQ